MNLPAFVSSIDEDVRATINEQLRQIEAAFDVRILYAIESGICAWSFPSPDSDYDVRFVYAHPYPWYLSIRLGRDVIEFPIDEVLDISGWDIRKALGLLLKPNPVMLEWFSSPIRYQWDRDTCKKLISFAGKIAHQTACLHHYASLARSQWGKHVGDNDEVNFKKYSHILRPALAIRWIRLHPKTAPPMNLQDLTNDLSLDDAMMDQIAHLLELKSKAKEIGSGPRIPAIDALIWKELILGANCRYSHPIADKSGRGG